MPPSYHELQQRVELLERRLNDTVLDRAFRSFGATFGIVVGIAAGLAVAKMIYGQWLVLCW